MKQKAIFWSRMLGWIAVACGVPITVFAVKFGLFKTSGYEIAVDELGNVTAVTPPALSGWGIISCLIIAWTVIQIMKEIRDSYTGYSLKKQILDGVLKLMPLIVTLIVFIFLRNTFESAIYCLAVIVISRLLAIPLNPLPKLKYETKGVEDYSDGLSVIVNKVKSKMKDGDK